MGPSLSVLWLANGYKQSHRVSLQQPCDGHLARGVTVACELILDRGSEANESFLPPAVSLKFARQPRAQSDSAATVGSGSAVEGDQVFGGGTLGHDRTVTTEKLRPVASQAQGPGRQQKLGQFVPRFSLGTGVEGCECCPPPFEVDRAPVVGVGE
jgi:hypothetical protein